MERHERTDVPEIERKQLLMLMLGIDPRGGIAAGLGGITRLQKYLFLLEQEEDIRPTRQGFGFQPYKAGPYSRRIYDDLELLENLGYIRSDENGEADEWERIAIADLSFDHLLGDDANAFSTETEGQAGTADALQERKYTLTERGRRFVEDLNAREDIKPYLEGIRRVKSRFSNYSLQDLLYYVYTKYEASDWISESEIRDQVLSRRGRNR